MNKQKTLKTFYETYVNLYKDIDEYMKILYQGFILYCDREDVGNFDIFQTNDNNFFSNNQILSLLLGDNVRLYSHDYKLSPLKDARYISNLEYDYLYDMLVKE